MNNVQTISFAVKITNAGLSVDDAKSLAVMTRMFIVRQLHDRYGSDGIVEIGIPAPAPACATPNTIYLERP